MAQTGPLWDALMALRDAQITIDDILLGERGESLSPEETRILAVTSRDILQARGNIRNLRDALQAARGAHHA